MQRCSEKAFAKCPTRHLCGRVEDATFADNSECAAFNRAVEDAPMTNGDRIRAMSDEELAKHFSGMICDINEGVEYHETPSIWLEWLLQPAEGSL